MSKLPDYGFWSIRAISERIRRGEVSPVDLVAGCLNKIELLNPGLNAFITVLADHAMQAAEEAAKEIAEGHWRGPLHGIPIGVKDMYDTAGIRTTAAFEYFLHRVPARDAAAVTRLKEAGAIVIGKTNMHTLAMGTTSVDSYFGAVHNPWDDKYAAGGSSGGSAAAVAAGLCYATLDTDAIGSCRLPASCCGVTGFKGTYGLISNRGILEGEKADEVILKLAHAAFMTRSADDAAIMLNILADRDVTKSEFAADYCQAIGALREPRVGIVKGYKATESVGTIFTQTVETFRRQGCSVVEMDKPMPFPTFDISTIEEDRNTISHRLFKDFDVLVLPTMTDVVPTMEMAEARGPQGISPENTFFCNYYGLPAISIPCGYDYNGLPVGLQIVGPAWGEGAVLDLAFRFQQVTPWHESLAAAGRASSLK